MGDCGELCNFASSYTIKEVRVERFIGNIEAKMDAKGRVFVPSPFRKILQQEGDNKLILRRDVYQPCLVIYSESVWNNELDTLTSRLSRYNPSHQMLLRQFVAEAEVAALDANGRILIPRRLLQAASIDENVRFLGMDTTIEIWNADRTQEPFMDPEEMMRQMAEILGSKENSL